MKLGAEVGLHGVECKVHTDCCDPGVLQMILAGQSAISTLTVVARAYLMRS